MKDVKVVGPAAYGGLCAPEHSVALSLEGANGHYVNPEEVDCTKKLSTACALSIRDYMQTRPDGELGCMIRVQQPQLIPFENTDPSWYSVRLGTDRDFLRMAELYRAGCLWGWAHSHPGSGPYPSITDLTQHSLCINMVIYGGARNRLSIYSTAEINQLYEATKTQGGMSSYDALEQWLKGKE